MTSTKPRRKPAAPKTNAAGQTPDESAADHIVHDWCGIGGLPSSFTDSFRHDVLEALRSARAQGRREGLEEAVKAAKDERTRYFTSPNPALDSAHRGGAWTALDGLIGRLNSLDPMEGLDDGR